METTTLFPFERNRYYSGKLLTSSDFLSEQTYMSNKRRFLNALMFGPGVICGLSVVGLDDLSIIIESGAALDALGREIVLENSVVRRLSTIEGFEDLESGEASLCIRYAEESAHPVYSINQQPGAEEYEFNRVKEGYALFLIDKKKLLGAAEPITEFIGSAILYQDQDFRVTVSIPQIVCKDLDVLMHVEVLKLSDMPKTFLMDSLLQTPSFVSSDGKHEVSVHVAELMLKCGETARTEHWMTAGGNETSESIIITKPSLTTIRIDGIVKEVPAGFTLKSSVTDMSLDELIDREIGRISLDARNLSGGDDYIVLADFTLERTKNACIVEKIEEFGVKRYIPSFAGEKLRREFSAYFSGGGAKADGREADGAKPTQPAYGGAFHEPVYASGVLEIPLGINARKGEVKYSGEIMHGLGNGNVYVEVGTEFLYKDIKLGEMAKVVIYGNADLFNGDGADAYPIANVQTAVKVMNDRGSFMVAAKLLEDTAHALIVLRWVALRMPGSEERLEPGQNWNRSIAAEQPTVVLAFRESHFFSVRFKNMEPCSLVYELTDKNSGSITLDGIYTAPAKEGVYEICISCADAPSVRTYAYAVVKRSGAEKPETDS